MQAVILAAGNSSRLFPFGGEKQKATISLLGKTLITRTVESLRACTIEKIIIVVSPGNGVEESFADQDISGIRFVTHIGAKGMGEALLDASEFITEDFYLLHAHHFECVDFFSELLKKRDSFLAKGSVVIREEKKATPFGIVKLEGDRISGVIEKPERAEKNERIVGMYLLPRSFLATLSSEEKHHYSFESALDVFVKDNLMVALRTEKPTITLKYPWHILSIGDFLLSQIERKIDESATIAKNAVLEGNIVIGKNATVENGAVIKGPCFIGENAYIGTNAILRGGVIIEQGAVIGANMEVKHSIIMDMTTTHSGYIGDSVIGASCKIAAAFCTGNVRIDRENVAVHVKESLVDSGLRSLGAFVGDGTKVGIRASTMPGVLIGRNVTVGPSTTIFKNIADNSKYYAKITEIIETKNSTPKRRKKVVLFDIDYTMFNTDEFKSSDLKKFSVFEEVAEALSSVGAYAELGIFSEGDKGFQQEKLLQTAVNEHFLPEHVHIVAKKIESLPVVLDKYAETMLFFVDDRLGTLQEAKKYKPDLFTIWMKRGPFASSAMSDGSFVPDATIEDLRMVLGIVAEV